MIPLFKGFSIINSDDDAVFNILSYTTDFFFPLPLTVHDIYVRILFLIAVSQFILEKYLITTE